MKNISRLTVAAVLVGILVIVATGVWAAPTFDATVPEPPVTGEGGGDGGGNTGVSTGATDTIKMGTASFTPGFNSTAKVELVKEPVAAPEGLAFVGDVFTVSTDPQDATVQVCYAYPPELADKEAKIYSLDEKADPQAWVEVSGSVVSDGKICVNSAAGVFGLIGKK